MVVERVNCTPICVEHAGVDSVSRPFRLKDCSTSSPRVVVGQEVGVKLFVPGPSKT